MSNETLPIEQFYRDVFVRDWLGVCNQATIQLYTQAVDWFVLFIGQGATIEDISDDALEGYTEWLVQTHRAERLQRYNNAARTYASRLRQIRRYAIAREHPGDRDMRLNDFLTTVYLRERSLQGASAAKYRRVIASVAEFYGSEIMLSEVTPELVDGWQAWYRRTHRDSLTKARSIVLAVWRLAYDMGLSLVEDPFRAKPVPAGPVITSGDNLRMLCTARYFPAKWSIQAANTKDQYRFALNDYAQFLGREATIADLTDSQIMKFMRWLRDERKLAPRTINERKGRITALWRWLNARGYLQTAPTVDNMPCVQPPPVAWTREELAKLFDAAKRVPGNLGRFPTCDFWTGLLMFLWNTGERIGGAMSLEWSDISPDGRCHIPGNRRKGGKDAYYRLWPETLEALERLRTNGERKVFAFPKCSTMLYHNFRDLLKMAGLSCGRKDMFHKMRRSFATWLRAGGQNDSLALGHSSSDITERSYRDPRIIGAQTVVLFKPWETTGQERGA